MTTPKLYLFIITDFKRSILAYRQKKLLSDCNTNNDAERQNNTKHSYLKKHRSKSLTGMLIVVIEEFLPEKYNK